MTGSLLWYGSLSALSLAAVGWMLRRPRRDEPGAGDSVRIRVHGGYEPERIVVPAGRPVRLVFHRDDTLLCSEHVVFPAFGRSAMLPPHEDVTVELRPEQPGEYEFTCRMGILRGRLVVTGGAAAGNGARRR